MTEATVEEKKSVKLSQKLEDVAKQIENLTALELSDLVKGLEERLGIQAAAPMPAWRPCTTQYRARPQERSRL